MYKILLVGKDCIGKTAFVTRFTVSTTFYNVFFIMQFILFVQDDRYSGEQYIATVGIDFVSCHNFIGACFHIHFRGSLATKRLSLL